MLRLAAVLSLLALPALAAPPSYLCIVAKAGQNVTVRIDGPLKTEALKKAAASPAARCVQCKQVRGDQGWAKGTSVPCPG